MSSNQGVPTILKKIIRRKCEEVIERKNSTSQATLEEQIKTLKKPLGFIKGLKKSIAISQPAVIAEIKKASPSKGVIRENFKPAEIAHAYQMAGASCLSVLTDIDFFQGHDRYLQEARKTAILPILRKDFIVDEYQVYETRALGADCILLIAAVFMHNPDMLKTLVELAHELQLDVLLEVHNEAEMELAIELPCQLVGINNRDLHTFNTSLDTTMRLQAMVPPDRLLVTESGIHTRDDVQKMRDNDIHAFLVGEAFMRAPNPGDALKELFF